MSKELCSICGKETEKLQTVGDCRFDEIGIPVLLKHVSLIHCDECGNIDPIIPDLNGLMHVVAFAVISHPCKLRSDEIRFLRKYLGKSGKEFAKLLDIDPTTLSKWENGQDIGPQSDRLIRLLVTTISKELRPKSEELVTALWKTTDCYADAWSELQIDPETLEYEYSK